MKLSITIPSLPTRTDNLKRLYSKIESQIPAGSKDVEILSIVDNKTMSVGRKRQALFQLARGEYICQIDDDDDVSDNFVSQVLSAIEETRGEVEVINYLQRCDLDGDIIHVHPSIQYPMDDRQIEMNPKTLVRTMYRYPWHWSCWRSDIAKQGMFYDCNSQEDTLFPKTLKNIVTTEFFISEILVHYIWRTTGTEAPFINYDTLATLPISNLRVMEHP